jgi:predicted permease
MSLARGWRRLFRLPFSGATPQSLEREVDDELAFHLAMRAEKFRRFGMTDERAQDAALARFGDRGRVRDECIDIDRQYARELRLMELFESILTDARYAYRSLRKTPGFTIVATLTLALGIGVTSAMYSLVDGILLRPLPFPHPERLVQFRQAYPEKGLDHWPLSQENLAMYRDRATDFESFAGYTRRGVTLQGTGRPERLSGARVTGDFFAVLGVRAALGRTIVRDDDRPNDNNVIVLTDGFWQSHFAGDRSVIGRVVDIDGLPTRVIGVMPPGFAFPRPDISVYLPLGLDPTRRFGWFLTGIGRLKPGATVHQAELETTALMWNWARVAPGLMPGGVDPRSTQMKTLVTPLHTAMTGDVARPLAVLQAAVVVILLIAIANVATLVTSRASGRSREMALRTAIGATRRRIVRQLLTESVALASLGGLVGIALAYVLVRTFTHSSAISLPRIGEVTVSVRVLLFTLAVSVASGVLFGLSPVLHSVRRRLADALASGGKDSAHGSARRLNMTLVVTQLALSVVLLVSAGLVLKSFQRLAGTNLGFEPRGVTSVIMPLPQQKYGDDAKVVAMAGEIVDRVRAIPGVRAAAVTDALPYSGNVNSDGYLIEGHAPPAAAGSETQTVQLPVTPGYFATLQIPLLHGRDFTSGDRANSLPVVIVDDELAHRYWKAGDAIGKRMRLTGDTTWRTIVGVVGSIRDIDAAQESTPHSYFPYSQNADSYMTLAIRTDGDPRPVIASVRRTIAELEPSVPLDNVRPLSESVAQALDNRRLTEILLASFSLLAATLAGVGIYGVMSLQVANRRREFGIRLAIGAEPRNLVRRVMGEGLVLALAGVGVGIAGALVATRWVRALLYDVSPTDPVVFTALSLGLLALAVGSCYLPARRAARSDPLIALRAD